jgi:hypothetical protein
MRAFVACIAATAPFASHAAGEGSGGAGLGLAIFLGFVAVVYLLVAVMRSARGNQRSWNDEPSVDEFVRRTTSTDRPSIER